MIVDVYIFRLRRLVQTTEPLSCRVIASKICDNSIPQKKVTSQELYQM